MIGKTYNVMPKRCVIVFLYFNYFRYDITLCFFSALTKPRGLLVTVAYV